MKTLVIAEAGVNHNGELQIAHQLIDAAVNAGADMVKFQTFRADQLVTTTAKKADYQDQTTDASESQHEMIRKLELSIDMHEDLLSYCNERGIIFFSTAFDLGSLDLLNKIGLELFKIPSGEITNLPYLRHVGGFGKPILLSTGMSNLGEIEAAVEILVKAGTPRKDITLLHCNTEYPTPMADVNLKAMVNMGIAFNMGIGYSDHTLGIEVPIAAVALGAKVIEKHFTLSRDLIGPDHKASLEPDEFKKMVSSIRNIELALGDGIKRPSFSEQKNMPVARKSLIASRDIKTGELFSEKNVMVKRPGTGISPMLIDNVIGRKAPRDFSFDELITLY